MVYSACLQADGNILVGGAIDKIAGVVRNDLGRLLTDQPASQSLAYDGTNITWLRGGTSPEVWRTTFEYSPGGSSWIYLGDGVRIAGGWQSTNVMMPTNVVIRARGFVAGGKSDGSAWYVESACPQTTPEFIVDDGNLRRRTNQFGCSISGTAGSFAVVESSTNLLNWSPLATNLIYFGPQYFSDSSSTNAAQKFYRIRLH